jgi:hypothetical protein
MMANAEVSSSIGKLRTKMRKTKKSAPFYLPYLFSGLVIPEKKVLDTKYGASFVAWVYMERDGKKDEAMFSWDGKEGASRGITIGIDKKGALFADIYRQRYVIGVQPPFGKPLKLRKWYLVGFSYNFYTGIFYLWAWDPIGQVNGAETFLGRVIIETRGKIHIGTKPPFGPYRSFEGRISCVMLFNKPAHIQKLVAAGKECEVNLLTTSKGKVMVMNAAILCRIWLLKLAARRTQRRYWPPC